MALTLRYFNDFAKPAFRLITASSSGGAENAGVENAGVENTGAKTYGKPSKRKINFIIRPIC